MNKFNGLQFKILLHIYFYYSISVPKGENASLVFRTDIDIRKISMLGNASDAFQSEVCF